ncbi:hypothetical protein D3C86_1800620 [compost metagenome]
MIPKARTARSMASCRVVAGGPPNTAAIVSRWICPTDGSPVVDIIEVNERTRSGCSMAIVCAIAPPIDAPTT